MEKIKSISYSLGKSRSGLPRATMKLDIKEGEELKNKVFIDSGFSVSLNFGSMKALIIPLQDPSDIQVTDIIIEYEDS